MFFKCTTLALFGLLTTSAVAQEAPEVDIRLVMVFKMADGKIVVQDRKSKSIAECKGWEQDVQYIAERSSDVIDVGTICLKTEFEPKVKRKV